ncbi:hypothetical protein ACN9MH_05070 [Paenibacillus silvae]|uniref:hypothetical protein n=1 Tax=Paenibacillus TaxID=44249 RepID=UPI001C100863|nr:MULTISPECIES: hypothetical protein [Paenibacillus]MBU5353359.1 hypothetical protein [Paenibacillus barcinonensis]MDM5279680.1 hypothetical protein [Paenibacillus silvae]
MEYSLKLNGRQDALGIRSLLLSNNFKVSHTKNKNNDEFELENGLKISIYDNLFPPNHPAASYETMFQEEDFIYEQTISYELKNDQNYELCYKTMYEISFAILKSLKVNGVFYHTSGEEIFFYKDGKYTFNRTYLELLQKSYGELLKHIEYEVFMK